MNVCFIAQQSIGMVSGGPRTQVEQTARYLRHQGVEVDFFDQWEGFRSGTHDLIHVFGANMMNYDIATRLHQFGSKFVVSSIFYSMQPPWKIRMARAMEKTLAKKYRGVWTEYGISSAICNASNGVLPNTSEEALIIESGFGVPRDKIRLIPNGVEDRFYKADPGLFINSYGVSDFILNVGHIGSLRKNVLGLIRALKNIDRPAVIIGKIHRNSYSDQCLKEAAANKNILIIDGLSNDSKMLESAYAACHTFVLPSYFETPGIAALEAALAGASVVITPHGGTREYFLDHAVYVNPRSLKSIEQGIRASLDRPRSSDLQQRILNEFLWQTVADKTLQAYEHFL